MVCPNMWIDKNPLLLLYIQPLNFIIKGEFQKISGRVLKHYIIIFIMDIFILGCSISYVLKLCGVSP